MKAALSTCLVAVVAATWRSVSVEDFGAVGDNQTDSTDAFRGAFEAVRGGGEVLVPAKKVYRTAPFNLTSNVRFLVEGTVRALDDFRAFPMVEVLPSYGHDLDTLGHLRRHPFVYAVGASNISIMGSGVIDGAGELWWPHFNNHSIDPGVGRPHLMELNNCTDVEISGVTLLNSAFWTLHPIYCRNVHIHDMSIVTPFCQNYSCANTDGIDIDSTSDVLIEKNFISCGDDHVTVLAGAGEAGRLFGMPSRNITIRNNRLGTGMGMSIGSSVSGGVEDVLYTGNVMTEIGGEWGIGAHLKTRVQYGGYVRNVAWVDNVFRVAGKPGGAINIETGYQSSGQCTASTCTEIRDIVFRNLTFDDVGGPGSLECYPQRPCVNITFENVHLATRLPWNCKNVASGSFTDVTPGGLAEACGLSTIIV